MVDEDHNVWNLECNISPDLSKGTDVLDRLVPNAFTKLWEMLLVRPMPQATRSGVSRTVERPEGFWDG
jgi:hypothetical protein